MPAEPLPPTPATTVRRLPQRARYDRDTVDAILDEGFVAHVGIALEDRPVVIPMAYGRDGDRMLLHGSVASRLLHALDTGVPVCATVTLVDGIVLARSQRNHSLNYRSVVVFGTARRLHGPQAIAALTRIVDHIVPGRSAESRGADDAEAREVIVAELPIVEASAKIRSGPPLPAREDDEGTGAWAGVLPLALTAGAPTPDARTRAATPPPASVDGWTRRHPSG